MSSVIRMLVSVSVLMLMANILCRAATSILDPVHNIDAVKSILRRKNKTKLMDSF